MPSGGGTLSFYVWRATTDTVRYDWQTCEIRDTTPKTLQSLFNVASNAKKWELQSVALSSAWYGKPVVLWCNVHEDGDGHQPYMYAGNFAAK